MTNSDKDEPRADAPDEDDAKDALTDAADEDAAPDADEPASDDVGDDAVTVEDERQAPARETGEAPTPDVVVEKRRGASATVAWLALFLALATTAGVGYLYVEKLRSQRAASSEDDVVRSLTGKLDETASALAELDGSVDELVAAQAASGSDLATLERDIDERLQLVDSLPPRMTSLERSVAALQGVSLDARNTYLIAEAEYYMQVANAQLQLAGNPYLASLALEQADDRLLQLADPALTDVRRALSDEIRALEVMEKPDVAGVSLTLASLARVVDSLPLRRPSEDLPAHDDAADNEESGAARAWGTVKGAFSGLVKHTPPSDDGAPLLTPDAEPLIRSNLSLQLQAARLALLRGEQEIFEQSLDDASAWLSSYFDVGSEAVAGAQATIAEIREGYSSSAAPDISSSLRLLRQYKSLAESDE